MLNKNFMNRLLLTLGLLMIGCTVGSAQGLYYNYYLDGVYMDTGVYGYGGVCGGASYWSTINGNYGSNWAPATIYQSTYLSAGSSYTWGLGMSYSFPDPYSGNCISTSFSWTFPVSGRIAHTYFQFPSYLGNGVCQWDDLACQSGSSPTCIDGLLLDTFPSGQCPYYQGAGYGVLTVNGSTTNYCSSVAYPVSASGPGVCD